MVVLITEDVFEYLLKAGKIGASARDAGAKLIKPGSRVYEICDTVERIILEAGAKPSFPCNFSINNEAAHYSPRIGDQKTVPEGAVVKLDIGAHIDGYIVDTAVTVSLDGKYAKLVEATREALNSAISVVKAGVSMGDIGKVIERTIRSMKYKPIWNLGGHLIRRYELHAGVFVPNVGQRTAYRINDGETYAIEPFATDGKGEVIEGKEVTIFSLRNPNIKNLGKEEEEFLSVIAERFNRLPFSERWLSDRGDPEFIRSLLTSLSRRGALHAYPVLMETGNGYVAQFEHTVAIYKGEVVVLTKSSET